MPVTTGSFAKALWPGVNAWYGEGYAEHTVEYTDLFDSFGSRKAYEEDVGISGMGLATVKTEGAPVAYDTEQQGFLTRYRHVTYGLGIIITREAYEDDLYDVVGEKKSKGLAFSMRQTKEVVCANTYNRAQTANYTGGDGVTLLSAVHPRVRGGTFSNVLSVAASLSEAALEDLCIQIMKETNDADLQIAIMPETLHIPPALVFEAERILYSPLRVGTADNDLNALKNMGKFRNGVRVNHYFSSDTAYFIRTNCPDGMKYFSRRDDDFSMDNDFDSDNAKYKGTMRFSCGWTDPRGLYGSEGI